MARQIANLLRVERHLDRHLLPLAFLVMLLMFGGGMLSMVGASDRALSDEKSTFRCTVASVTDGDTFRCSETDMRGRQIRVRVSGISARERNGTCSPGHPCPAASAEAATEEMRQLVFGKVLDCTDVGETYGRVAAFCKRADGIDISCAMVASGTAVRWERFWGQHDCN